jgi:RNA polymerase sigma-70 factor (ECF subfamily)
VDRDQENNCIDKILAGDRNAYAILVDNYKDMVFSLALRLVRNREEAEEIAQDAFVKAFRSLGSFKGKARFSTWLYKIVYNTAISSLRKKEIEKVQMDNGNVPDLELTDSTSMYASLSEEERKRFIDHALEILEEEEKVLIIMYYFEARELDELAEITGLSKTNVKVRLYRSRQKMLTFLKSYLQEETYSLL